MSETEVIKEKESFRPIKSQYILELTGGAIFAALSGVFAWMASILARAGIGMAYFDPISIVWVFTLFIFGPVAALLSSSVGMLLLMPFDPFAPIGPLMKFAATLTLMLVYIIPLKLYKREQGVSKCEKLKPIKKFLIIGIIATGVRIGVMAILNVIAYLGLGYAIEGLGAWLVTTAILNAVQSIWDLAIPYITVFGLKINERFQIW
jgi:riboflavin transporter FmnP